MIELGTLVYKPCSLDILEFKVTAYGVSEACVVYTLKATHPIGAQRKVEVLVTGNNNRLHYAGTSDDDEDNTYSRGLVDFIEGEYYVDKAKARIAYYDAQEMTCRINLDAAERIVKERKETLLRVQGIIKQIKESLETTK